MPSMMPFGMSRLGSTDSSEASGNCSIARNSQTAKGIGGKDAVAAEGQERPVPVRQRHRRPVGIDADVHRPLAEIELAREERAEEEEDQDRDGDQRDDHRHREGQRDAAHVEADEDDVADEPPQRLPGSGVPVMPVM